MNRLISLLQCLVLIISLFITISVSATPLNIPLLSPNAGTFVQGNYFAHDHPKPLSAFDPATEFETFYYNQTLDHFNFRPDSFNTFQQRYLINFNHWGGSNISAPIFAYLGEEEAIDADLSIIGFLSENANQFQALQIFIEHRYYGQSVPFGSREEAFKNASTIGYFNSAQAMADYAEILIHVKKQLRAEHSPVIVIGASYGGMLASWFRLKYPHVALGALASSAPILYFDNITPPEKGYYSIVTKDFQEASETCYQTIKKSWSEIDDIASKPEGLSFLSNKFHTCSPLTTSSELKNYLDGLYCGAAQYNSPPSYPVTVFCGGIDGVSSGNDTLSKIFAGVVAYSGNRSCYVNEPRNLSETDVGWSWQTCSDMVIPISVSNDSMFPPYQFDLQEYIDNCKAIYGVPPRPHWVTAYFGGHDIKLALYRFASNIIFSNGLRDPFSGAGVLENISDTVVAVHAKNGSHCLDVLRSNNITDPDWLVEQRKTEVKIIEGWLAEYYSKLRAFKQ
ncbi:lysosomal Pro-X carboxypeptidase-like [Pyrus ussuriensis x Pyrus communis]|uniref:Lysosomal Pro-X carboxypeptidase-like n=1 Tax=Pyrus ussuriensis x Pyrus communis TaxID=2448454 RepID=A0A5N5FYY0_9ROSA|nr:lysosomal Pro-X carboxypeptidase-like [Pyrus ussuriensis x Pyrus communis]